MVSSACFFFNFKIPKDNHFLFLSSKVSGTQVLQQHHSSMNLPLHLAPSVQSQRGIHNPSGVPQQGRLTWEGSKGGWFGPRGGGELSSGGTGAIVAVGTPVTPIAQTTMAALVTPLAEQVEVGNMHSQTQIPDSSDKRNKNICAMSPSAGR